MVNKTISLIVPIYNSERFLKSCLDSIFSQIRPDVEIVLVNDGSTDGSVEIIRDNYYEYTNIGNLVLIDQLNSGPGAARNSGVKAASGDYIGFLDSDDLLCDGYFRSIIDIIKSDCPDILQFHVERIPEDTQFDVARSASSEINSWFSSSRSSGYTIYSHSKKSGLYMMERVRLGIFKKGKWFPVSRVFRKSILTTNRFPDARVFYEDISTIPFIFLENHKISLMDNVLIKYRSNPSGTTQNHTPENLDTLYDIAGKIQKLGFSDPLIILYIQVARGIVYFSNELELRDERLTNLLQILRNLPRNLKIIRYLKPVDMAFVLFPNLYNSLEWCRQNLRKAALKYSNNSSSIAKCIGKNG